MNKNLLAVAISAGLLFAVWAFTTWFLNANHRIQNAGMMTLFGLQFSLIAWLLFSTVKAVIR